MFKRQFSTVRIAILISLLSSMANACSGQQAKAEQKVEDDETRMVYDRVDNTTFKSKMGGEDVIILDVRTPAETDRGVIEGALLIDYRSPGFEDELAKLDKEKTYLVYCQSGGRSARTC
ncbi:MAG: rhodanese-like domain-containing protein, partial [Bacteroidota bacterium]